MIAGQLEWHASESGYRFADCLGLDASGKAASMRRYLVPKEHGVDATTSKYRVDNRKGLLAEFADIGPDGEGQEGRILSFADRNGPMGLFHWAFPDGTAAPVQGEPVATWQREVRRATEAVRLWSVLASGDERTLARRLRVPHSQTTDKAMAQLSEDARRKRLDVLLRKRLTPPGTLTDVEREQLHALSTGKASGPAFGFVATHTGEFWVHQGRLPAGITTQARLRLAGMVTSNLVRLGALNLTWAKGPERFVLAVKPPTLLAAMWLQFADAIGDERFRTCEWCGEVLDVNATGRPRRFCPGGRCQKAAERAAKREGQQ